MIEDWQEDKPCKLREQLENDRADLRELHDRLTSEIARYSGEFRELKYQKMLSKKRRYALDINALTKQIKQLKEMDGDEEARRKLDEEFDRINKLTERFNEMVEDEEKTDEENCDDAMEEIKGVGREWEVGKTDTSGIDDLLNELGL